jgi:predicted metalloprotease with PDZ domain
MKNMIIFMLCITAVIGLPPAVSADEGSQREIIISRSPGSPWLGVQAADVDSDRVDLSTLPRNEGAYVLEVIKESPADSAGLQRGDVIIRFGDREIYDAGGLVSAVRKSRVGESLRITVIRNGGQAELTAVLGQRETPHRFSMRFPGESPRRQLPPATRSPVLGISAIDLNPQLAGYLRIPGEKGVLVEQVYEDSPSERSGIRAGDVIVSVDGHEVATTRALRRKLREYEPGATVMVGLIRDGNRETVKTELAESAMPRSFNFDFDFDIDFDFDPERFELEIFGPEGVRGFKERLHREIRSSVKPGLEGLREDMHRLKDRLKEI